MALPFAAVRWPHADDTDSLKPQASKHHDDNTANVHANCDPAFASAVRSNDQRVVKECLVEIGEIQPVLGEVGQPFRFVPDDIHRLNGSCNSLENQVFCSYDILA